MTAIASEGQFLLSYFEEQQSEILAFIQWLVEQESMTGAAPAIARLGESLAERLSRSGASVDLVGTPAHGVTLRARLGESRPDQKQLLVLGHLDTVWPIGTLAVRPFRVEGDRAYGPGIFDMKAGVAVAWSALNAIRELGRKPQRAITLLLTCDEESGSICSRELIEEEGRRSEAALVLEPPIPGGKLKTGRKGVGQFELVVRGRSAHAGNDPGAGINALIELAHQILAIDSMNDHERGTTLNVGVVHGGVLPNVVPAEAHALVDVRFRTIEEGNRISEALSALRPVLTGSQIDVRGGINRPPMVRTEAVGALFEHAKKLADEIGLRIGEGYVGGGSDGNFVAALGVPVLDGLGVDGAGPHSENEHIVISDIAPRAALLTRLIETI